MKLSQQITLSLAVVAAAGVVIYITRSSKTKRMLNQIADEGYETAQDILFPGKKLTSGHLKYGPVIPDGGY